MSTSAGEPSSAQATNNPTTSSTQSGGLGRWARENAGKAVGAIGFSVLALVSSFFVGRLTAHDQLVSSIREDRKAAYNEYIVSLSGWIDTRESMATCADNESAMSERSNSVEKFRSRVDAARLKINTVGSNVMIEAASSVDEYIVVVDENDESMGDYETLTSGTGLTSSVWTCWKKPDLEIITVDFEGSPKSVQKKLDAGLKKIEWINRDELGYAKN